MTTRLLTISSIALAIALVVSVALNITQFANLKGQLLFPGTIATTTGDGIAAPTPEPDGDDHYCSGTHPMCGGYCLDSGEICQSIRIDSNSFVCGCDLPQPENPCGGEPDYCSGNCAREDDVCRTLTDNDGTRYCTCFWEPQGTCGGESDACSGDCPVTRSCQTLMNESTGEQYCGCGHWSTDPRYDCDDKEEDTCAEGTCPEGDVCGAAYRLDNSFAGCGCQDPPPGPSEPYCCPAVGDCAAVPTQGLQDLCEQLGGTVHPDLAACEVACEDAEEVPPNGGLNPAS